MLNKDCSVTLVFSVLFFCCFLSFLLLPFSTLSRALGVSQLYAITTLRPSTTAPHYLSVERAAKYDWLLSCSDRYVLHKNSGSQVSVCGLVALVNGNEPVGYAYHVSRNQKSYVNPMKSFCSAKLRSSSSLPMNSSTSSESTSSLSTASSSSLDRSSSSSDDARLFALRRILALSI